MPRHDRIDCARAGMAATLNDFRLNSAVRCASRRADGLVPIDQAVAALDAAWVPNNGFAVANDAVAAAVLTACLNWLTNRRVFGMRITGWREAPIKELYWRVAWCYSCDNYVQQALAQLVANNLANIPTTLTGPVAQAAPEGSPYQFMNSEYSHHPMVQPPRLLRGDTRGPLSIVAANGFQPAFAGRWTYAPWFAGNATGGTPSTTTQEALPINACAGAHALGNNSPEGALPAWLDGAIQAVAGNPYPARRGYVYELGNLGNAMSTRVEEGAIGAEHVFLAVPAACITNWWVILGNNRTVGPFPFPPGLAAPGGVALSAAALQLA